jgi:hypothetical protein
MRFQIANCRLKNFAGVLQLAIGNRKLTISNIRMAEQPRLTKLGAKWVEVRKRRAQGFPVA